MPGKLLFERRPLACAVEQLFHQWLFQRLAPDRDSSLAQHFGSTNRQMTPLSPISLPNDLDADIGSTAHANGLGSTETEINRCAIAERSAIIDPDDHRPIVAWIGDADSCAKRECPVRRSQSVRVELLARCRALPSEFIPIISRRLSVDRAGKTKKPYHKNHYHSHL